MKSVSIAGRWDLRLDPDNEGAELGWYGQEFSDAVRLPGSLDTNRRGPLNPERSTVWLSRRFEYTGPAWYRRSIPLPPHFRGRPLQLFLERCHWQTELWVNGVHRGAQDSLCTPHVYDLTACANATTLDLALKVDNTLHIPIGSWGHSVSEHTQTNWNGVIGRMELQSLAAVEIRRLEALLPAPAQLQLRAHLRNNTGETVRGRIRFTLEDFTVEAPVAAPAGDSVVTASLALPPGLEPWDEFRPVFYSLTALLDAASPHQACFERATEMVAFRDLRTTGRRILLNGRPLFLRGSLEDCIFPLTGFPPTTEEEWQPVLQQAANHGLNHLRFHSWCPPEAAFAAADKLGLLLQVEAPHWWSWGRTDDNPARAAFVEAEVDRILEWYGHHPSFALLCLGNETAFAGEDPFPNRVIRRVKQQDARHLYLGSAHGSTVQPEDQVHVLADNLQPGDEQRLFRGNAWTPTGSRFSQQPPATDVDYGEGVRSFKKPVIGHEVGQWCVYPNFREMASYTGVLEPRNFQVFRESLRENGMLDQADAFVAATGALSLALYKEEIESSLRTPDLAGFQLLQLHDFPGQGSALVGMLDAFWQSKGIVTPEEFRRFCSPTVPLLRLPRRVWLSSDTLRGRVQLAHYGPESLDSVRTRWEVANAGGQVLAGGELEPRAAATGQLTTLGDLALGLKELPTPAELTLTVRTTAEAGEWANDWRIWVYPKQPLDPLPREVVHCQNWNGATRAALQAGRTVFLTFQWPQPYYGQELMFPPAFWSPIWFEKQPGTMGLLCDPAHPAFARFPTRFHSDWQWWDVVTGSRGYPLTSTPAGFRPVLQVIDRYDRNRKIGAILEARVGKGKLLACFLNLHENLEKRPAARQLRHSLLHYVSGGNFNPEPTLTLADLDRLFALEP